MEAALRVDVDGYYGLVEGVPALLDLFQELGVRASFFFNMGREATLWEALRYGGHGTAAAARRRYSLPKLARMLVFPRPLGSGHPEILKEAAAKGHEVGVHAWSHIKWGNALESIDPAEELQKMVSSYTAIFGRRPLGFAPPLFRMDGRVMPALAELGFTYVSSEFHDKPRRKEILEMPLTFPKTVEEAGVKAFRAACTGKSYRAVYVHADWEGRNIGVARKALEGFQFVPFADLVKRIRPPK